MRQLKYHETKLLKKVDLYAWNKKNDHEYNSLHVAKIIRRYHLPHRSEYVSYQQIVGMITSLSSKLQSLSMDDTFRITMTDQLLQKLYNLGIITTQKSLQNASTITVSAICRRRLPVLMIKLRMAQHLSMAITYIEQGQIRVGPNVITDPSFLVSRSMEDYITWIDPSKMKRTIQKYNNTLDDFDLL
jgi:U3 small nucleolar ribonucleoprotein protein IMP3